MNDAVVACVLHLYLLNIIFKPKIVYILRWLGQIMNFVFFPLISPKVFVPPALAGKTHRDHFVPCCLLLSVIVVVKTG